MPLGSYGAAGIRVFGWDLFYYFCEIFSFGMNLSGSVFGVCFATAILLSYPAMIHSHQAFKRISAVLFGSFFIAFPLIFKTGNLHLDWLVSCVGTLLLMHFTIYYVDSPVKKLSLKEYIFSVFGQLESKQGSVKSARLEGLVKVCIGIFEHAVLKLVAGSMMILPGEFLELPVGFNSFYHLYLYSLFLYLILDILINVGTGIDQIIFGIHMKKVFNEPFLARNPRDFWSVRWNRLFSSFFHRMIFKHCLKGKKTNSPWVQPMFAIAVFFFSGLIHEFINYSAFGEASGENMFFFLVNGVVTCIYVFVTKSSQKPLISKFKVARPVAIFLHTLFQMSIARYFFLPYIRGGFFDPSNTIKLGIHIGNKQQ